MLQRDPFGRKTALKKPLAANAPLRADGSSNGRGAGPRVEGTEEESFLDFLCCLSSVQPDRELMGTVVPVLRCLGMRTPRGMQMVFRRTTQWALGISLVAPDFEELSHPSHPTVCFMVQR